MDNQALDIITLQETPEEQLRDFTPKSFDDYLGQAELKKKLHIWTHAAKQRNEPLDHLLLFGPSGLGKTTLAYIMAQVMEVNIKICSGPMMERTGDIVAIVSSLEPRDILFIDEIHRMPTAVEEVLYNAMEHYRVDVIIGQGAGARSVNLPLNPFTLIGATTKSGMISAPLRGRFGITERLDFYTPEDLKAIIQQNAQFLEITITPDAALMLAQCSRGTPRIAKKLIRRVRDMVQFHNKKIADSVLIQETLIFLGIDDEGLTRVDIMLLEKLVVTFRGGPVGLETLASMVGEDKDTIETVYEPFLMRMGYIEKTPRGRQIPATRLPFLKQRFLGQRSIG